MSFTLTQVNAAADTFQAWLDLTNQMANLISNSVVTANGDANGAQVTGNTRQLGTFSANTFAVVTALRGGNVQSNATLSITSNVAVSGDNISVGNSAVNAVMNSSSIVLSNTTVNFTYKLPTSTQKASNTTFLGASGNYIDLANGSQTNTSGTSAQEVDNFLLADFYSMEYTITVNDNVANNRTLSKILILHDEGTAYLTEYAVVESNSNVGSFSANANSTAVRVYLTPTSADTTVKVRREGTKK